MSIRRAAAWSLIYIVAALIFGVALGLAASWDLGAQFFAGYVVEKSLSVDNLFVFVIVMSTFAVPAEQQPRVLTFGIALALVLRAAFIGLGAALLSTFSFMFLVFGLGLIATAVQLFRHRDQDPSVGDNALIAFARRRSSLSPTLLALIAIGTTDVLFALDSIPAVYGVTSNGWIVLAANVFALLGLRALFFLVSGLLDRLVYLSTGLSVILLFIGSKLVLHFGHEQHHAIPELSTGLSLLVIAVVLAVTTGASLARVRRDPSIRAHAGSLRGPAADGEERFSAIPQVRAR
ncbi:MAG TPA: TerC family protein [Solirubrobacteraceae bacterium]|jgi:tellurite resistance protein TerC